LILIEGDTCASIPEFKFIWSIYVHVDMNTTVSRCRCEAHKIIAFHQSIDCLPVLSFQQVSMIDWVSADKAFSTNEEVLAIPGTRRTNDKKKKMLLATKFTPLLALVLGRLVATAAKPCVDLHQDKRECKEWAWFGEW
jgi:hypothetical protein